MADILKDVVAYVETRGDFDCNSAVRNELICLGARTELKFTTDVTHVIYKEGTKKTHDRAVKKKIPLVSVTWVKSCKENGRKMPEADFPPLLPEIVYSPLPMQKPKWKARRQIMPSNCEGAMTWISEKIKGNKNPYKAKSDLEVCKDSTPSLFERKVLAPETQARSPFSLNMSSLRKSTSLTTIPDTPYSQLSAPRKEGDDESPVTAPRSPEYIPLRRKLFLKLANDLANSDDSESDLNGVKTSINQLIDSLNNIIRPKDSQSPRATTVLPDANLSTNIEQVADAEYNHSTKTTKKTICVDQEMPTCSKYLDTTGVNQTTIKGASTDVSSHVTRCRNIPTLEQNRLPINKNRRKTITEGDVRSKEILSRRQSTRLNNSVININSRCINNLNNAKIQNNRESTLNVNTKSKSRIGTTENSKDKDKNSLDKTVTVCMLKPKTAPRKRKLHTEVILSPSALQPDSTSSEKASTAKSKRRLSKINRQADVDFLFSQGRQNQAKSPIQSNSDSTTQHKENKSLRKPNNKPLTATNVESEQMPSTSNIESTSANITNRSKEVPVLNDLINCTRRSIDEFSLAKNKQGYVKIDQNLTFPQRNPSKCSNKSTVNESKSQKRKLAYNKTENAKKLKSIHCTEEIDTLNISSSAESVPSTSLCLRHGDSFVREKRVRMENSMVVTSLHRVEQDVVYSVVRKLSGFAMENDVQASSTHVVCGEPRRTLNLLRAIGRGCWLIDKSWVLKSLESNRWLPEEEFEMSQDYPASRRSRLDRQAAGPAYKVDLFSSVGPILVSDRCSPARKHLVELINLCSGYVTGSSKRANVFVGTTAQEDKQTVQPTWILDCIERLELLPWTNYTIPIPTQSQREKSPEF